MWDCSNGIEDGAEAGFVAGVEKSIELKILIPPDDEFKPHL